MDRHAIDFRDEFKRESARVRYTQERHFSDKILIKGDDYKCKYAIIQNVSFGSGIEFNNIYSLGAGLKFVNCKGKITINDCNVNEGGFDLDFDGGQHSVIFESCNFTYIRISDSFLEKGIRKTGSKKLSRLELHNIEYRYSGIYIEDLEAEELIDISNIKSYDGGIRFHKSAVKARLRLFDIKVPSLSFTESEFTKDIFLRCSQLNTLSFNDSKFLDEVKLTGNTIKKSLGGIGSSFLSFQLGFFDSGNEVVGWIGKIFLKSCRNEKSFVVDGYSGKDIARGSLKDLEVLFDKSFDGDFHFQNLEINKTLIKGINPSANVEFSFCCLERVTFDGVNNDGLITLKSCEASGENPEIYLLTSSLGKTRFFNFDFSRFHNIHIVDSVLIDIICVRVTWFKDDQLLVIMFLQKEMYGNVYEYMDKSVLFGLRKEIYRQIKFALEKQGNRVQSLDFQALELESLRKELKFRKNSSLNDKATLLFSMTNDMGVNWVKPLIMLLASTLLFYLLFVWSLSENLEMYYPPKVIDFGASIAEYGKYLYVFPQLFNPARVLERMLKKVCGDCDDLGFWIYFIDGFQRIVLAFFIFQIVSAFRKFVNS